MAHPVINQGGVIFFSQENHFLYTPQAYTHTNWNEPGLALLTSYLLKSSATLVTRYGKHIHGGK
jgi:hypothetical protein